MFRIEQIKRNTQVEEHDLVLKFEQGYLDEYFEALTNSSNWLKRISSVILDPVMKSDCKILQKLVKQQEYIFLRLYNKSHQTLL